MQNALFAEFMDRIATQTERARAAGTRDVGVETLRGDKIEQASVADLWTCPHSGAVTRIVGIEVTDPVYIATAEEALQRERQRVPMRNRTSLPDRVFLREMSEWGQTARHLRQPETAA